MCVRRSINSLIVGESVRAFGGFLILVSRRPLINIIVVPTPIIVPPLLCNTHNAHLPPVNKTKQDNDGALSAGNNNKRCLLPFQQKNRRRKKVTQKRDDLL